MRGRPRSWLGRALLDTQLQVRLWTMCGVCRDAPLVKPTPPSEKYWPLIVMLTPPPFTTLRSELLVSSGETGKSDMVSIKYVDVRTEVFGYDHGEGADLRARRWS
jgi:hypothetical protein